MRLMGILIVCILIGLSCTDSQNNTPPSDLEQSTETADESNTDSNGDAVTDSDDDNESDTVDDSESDTVDDSEPDTVDDSESDTVDDSEPDTVDDSEPDTVDDSEPDTVDDSESDTVDDSEPDTVDDSESDTVDDSEPDTVDDSEPDTVDDSEPDADAISDTDTGVDTNSNSDSSTEFELMWEDNFDVFDGNRWELMTHSWDSNLAQFTDANATVENGILKLALTAEEGDTDKPFRGVEMRSIETITYGKIEASIRFAAGSAVISSLVLIYTPWPPDDWNEIDIEFLGKNTDRIQFNHMVNIPPADPETEHLQYPSMETLDFNPSEAFHTYAIEWVPEEVRFFVDGVLIYTATENISYLTLPQNILLTIWASNAASWAGSVDDNTAPTTADYDWIKVYRYRDGQ